MSRGTRDSIPGGRCAPAESSSLLLLRQQQSQQQRRVRGLAAAAGDAGEEGGDEGLDLFSKNRRSISVAPCGESDGQNGPPNLGRISLGSAKLMTNGMDDLLSAADMGKHDYDWLLTPPGSPRSSLDTRDSHLSSVSPTPRNNPSARSVSTTRTSRFSVSQIEKNPSPRPARSSSVTRPSVCATYSSSHISGNSNRTSVLNMSMSSMTSSRPSTPSNRSTTLSSTRQSAPTSSRPTSRSSTPSKTKPTLSSIGHSSRPSTPTSRSQNPATLTSHSTSIVARSSSRPSTPTRRAPAQTLAPMTARAPSVGRNLATNSRNSGPTSRPSSPGPLVKAPSQPIVLPDFPLDAPPNLRTKIPERPASAGRARPGLPLTVRANLNPEAVPPTNLNGRRSSSPIVTRGRLPDNNSPKLPLQSNGHVVRPPEILKPILQENVVRRPTKTTKTMESNGFGRTISKMSLDMALRHMDIRQGMGGIRGASLFPQSIRSSARKARPAHLSNQTGSVSSSCTFTEDNSCDGMMSCNDAASENGEKGVQSPEGTTFVVRKREPDVFDNSRYDAILLREDSRNLNWLHSVEDKSDQSLVFDPNFEPLPEPFVML